MDLRLAFNFPPSFEDFALDLLSVLQAGVACGGGVAVGVVEAALSVDAVVAVWLPKRGVHAMLLTYKRHQNDLDKFFVYQI